MKALLIGTAALIALAAVAPATAAEKEAVVIPDVFTAPPAFPGRREPVVVSDVFGAPPAFPAVKLYDWTGAYVGINAGGAFGRVPWTSTPDATAGTSSGSGALVGGTVPLMPAQAKSASTPSTKGSRVCRLYPTVPPT